MYIVWATNVPQAYYKGLTLLKQNGVAEPSRAGDVLVAPGPVVTHYLIPDQRVLFCAQRDANPFFHLVEAMWMLAGRNDGKYLDNYVRDFSHRFAEDTGFDDGGTIHDAYGHRWRHHFHFDQLKHIAQVLKKDPSSRQMVLQMWDCNDLVLPIDRGQGDIGEDPVGASDLRGGWKTRPCNTHAYFRIREGTPTLRNPVLDMMVCCRSNDMIWGGYGANAVHFSFLHEYMAAQIGVPMGSYYQMSWNFHAYKFALDNLDIYLDDRYQSQGLTVFPLVQNPGAFDREVQELMKWGTKIHNMETVQDLGNGIALHFGNPFLSDVVLPAMCSMKAWRLKAPQLALTLAEKIEAPDWRIACQEWLTRRLAKQEQKRV